MNHMHRTHPTPALGTFLWVLAGLPVACPAQNANEAPLPPAALPLVTRPATRPTTPSAQAAPANAARAHPAPVRALRSLTNPANAGRAYFVPVASDTRDSSPVSASLSAEPIDLRMPLLFDRVFAVRSNAPADMRGGSILNFGGGNIAASSAPLDSSGTQWFARIDGGIIALFPRSTYVQTPQGTLAEVPAGTVYVIGSPPSGMFAPANNAPKAHAPAASTGFRPTAQPAHLAAPRAASTTLTPADQSERTTVNSGAPRTQPIDTSLKTIMGDEVYRARRVRGLLLQAAGTVHRPSSLPDSIAPLKAKPVKAKPDPSSITPR